MKKDKINQILIELRKGRKSITQVRKLTKDGNEITDRSIINNELKQFYKYLYSEKCSMTEEQCMDYLSEVSTPSLAKEETEICEGKLTLQECFNSFKTDARQANLLKMMGLLRRFCLAFLGI